MSKSILFINQSSGYLMIDIVNAHASHYDKIVLLTGFLNPGKISLNPKVKVVNTIKYNRSGAFKRKWTWFSFWFLSLYFIFIKYRSYKLYFVTNPPLNVFSARFLNRDFAFLIYDVYPQALSKYNFLSPDSAFYKFWELSNVKALKRAKKIFTISEGMRKEIGLHQIIQNKIEIVPIWTNNNFFENVPMEKNKFLLKYNIKSKFIVSYSGNLGKSHPVEKVIDLAIKLHHEKSIMFLIIGNGEKKNHLLEKQKKFNLQNLKILDYQPLNLFSQLLASAHIGVVTSDQKAGHLNVPSKTFNLMSAAKPVLSIAGSESELAYIVESNQIGKNFNENQIDEICDFILELKNNKSYYKSLSENSKKTSFKYKPDNAKSMLLK